MLYGTNTLSWQAMRDATRGTTAIRAYSRDLILPPMPPRWAGAVTIASVKQPDLAGIIAGAYDSELTRVITSLPPESLLTVNHEGNGDHHGFSPSQWRKSLKAVQALAAEQRPGIKVGAIFTTWPVTHQAQNLAAWVEPDLDWYGLDGYQETAADTVASVFADAVERIHHSTAGPVMITETNSALAPGPWAVAAHNMATALGMTGFLHFADTATPYPNLPPAIVCQDLAVKCALDGIFN